MKIVKEKDSVTPNVLVVDDDEHNLKNFVATFRRNAKVHTASNAEEAMEVLAKENIHVLISDQRMPGINGDELLIKVRDKYPLVRRVIVTAYSDIEALISAVNEGGVMGYIAKPWKVEEVWAMIHLAYLGYLKESKTAERIEKLESMNQKLEFALRQRLLS